MTKAFDGGDYRAAELMLVRDTADFPEDADFLVRYALCATNSGRALDALPRWQAVVAVAPDLPMGWCGVASSYHSLKAFAPAEGAIKHALRRFPDDLTVLTEAGAFEHDALPQRGSARALDRGSRVGRRPPGLTIQPSGNATRA